MPSFKAAVHFAAHHQNVLKRLDLYIAEDLKLMSRSQMKLRSKENNFCAAVNGKAEKLSKLIKEGDILELDWSDPAPPDLTAEYIPLDIVFENDRVIVINKQQGLVVHPGAGNTNGTLVNGLLWHIGAGGQSPVSERLFDERPFIVHRLDKDTSGIIIAAKDAESIAFLSNQCMIDN
jgi:23S rRNA pseudouridine1911/1915/1917 synthase